ncbi:uncharacterized protein [Aegilops tauschii subsp. strangulata]|uniref:uncharacterized protein n=1 Tax=Aegilops tauschii subsp. strangulata TaxID=200361 RepID=UPI003CC89198
MLDDVFAAQPTPPSHSANEPEETGKAFLDILALSKKPLYEGAKLSVLDAILQLMAVKAGYGCSRGCSEAFLGVWANSLPKGHELQKTMHEYANDNYCRKCGSSRYIEVVDEQGQKQQLKIPMKVLRYLDFIKRLQRLFITEESAKMMKWHKEGKRNNPNKIVHPSEGEAWKSFDIEYPEEAAEAGNVRIAISIDGFNPYGMSSGPYSCWPVFVIPLNLPPGAIMQRKTMFLSLIIPGPEYLGKNLSMFMQPLVDDLHHSWYFPRLTYDRHLQKNFLMKLPYFKDFKLQYNIDVMHTEKNVAESLFRTILNIPDKTKDNVNARVDQQNICDRPRLHMQPPTGSQKSWFKPDADFVLKKDHKMEAFKWLKHVVKFTDGYAPNISKGVNLSTGKVTGLKSHDYHVWIERIMPVMVRGYVPKRVWRVLAELRHFFHTLCAKEVCPEMIKEMHKNAPELICKLEKIFPPGFFTPMTHLILHLANEVLLGAPVQNHWQYGPERQNKHLRQKCGNKAKIEASLAEAVILEEVADLRTTRFVDEEWTGMLPATKAEALALLRKGADGRKNFIAWFMEKGNDPNESIDEELRWVSMGFDPAVMTCEKYDVNGYRFHTEEHQNSRPDPKTINTGVFTEGDNKVDYYGRVELTFKCGREHLSFNVFKCRWFDPKNGLRHMPSKEYLKGWEVVFKVSPHGKLPDPNDDDYYNINPMTYEGVFFQEEHDDVVRNKEDDDLGYVDLDPNDDDARLDGEAVVNQRDIIMIENLNEDADDEEEPPLPFANHGQV